jgi:large subunit ribosomal protein L4e
MASRPQVTVYSADGSEGATVKLPGVFTAPIRTDVVTFVHTNMAKNRRQAYAISRLSGHQHSAESWGTGRAVARIPRISGGGTRRSGQGAFGNQCRDGRMFAPTKIWRRWHRRVNKNQRRFATASALAASALPALVEARGHNISGVAQVPLVVDSSIESISSTKKAVELLKTISAMDDVEKAANSRKLRSGIGKIRNRRHVSKRGPLVVYAKNDGVYQAFKNIQGLDLCPVGALNLLQLAPGGHVGRFIVWSKAAFESLDGLFGTGRKAANPALKKRRGADYRLPRHKMLNADVARLINSDEVQAVVRPAKFGGRRAQLKKNPLKNLGVLLKLNPYAKAFKREQSQIQQRKLDLRKK